MIWIVVLLNLLSGPAMRIRVWIDTVPSSQNPLRPVCASRLASSRSLGDYRQRLTGFPFHFPPYQWSSFPHTPMRPWFGGASGDGALSPLPGFTPAT